MVTCVQRVSRIVDDNFDYLRSSVSGVAWPAIPDNAGAVAGALQYQLDRSQWWTADELRAQQFRQLAAQLRHAAQTVPYYRDRLPHVEWSPDAVAEVFAAIPLLKRQDAQLNFETLQSVRVPGEHGAISDGQTTGSTGRPVRFRGTNLTRLLWCALTVRDHLWRHRDFGGKLAAIRSKVENGVYDSWGPATGAMLVTGPCALLNIATDVRGQLDWLCEQDPDYLLTHPSNLRALAQLALERGAKPGRLKDVRTFGETLPEDLRSLCRSAWNVPVSDVYSAEEVGYIALQCPEHEHYHVQAESLLVEILDAAGWPCAPGQVGRVVVTTLHNFAMPLIRYELGDYALAGGPCSCGRGLPVIERVMGRVRNMLVTPDGRRFWPSLPSARWMDVAPVRQYQIVQHAASDVEARLVVARPLTPDEEERLTAVFRELLGYPFRLRISCVDAIERGPGSKFEDFVSMVTP
jgi:phenylacetate-CoA ligase